jgi:predicted RNA-binding Zn-ribbon protein involved in translation (DUF1610 family)
MNNGVLVLEEKETTERFQPKNSGPYRFCPQCGSTDVSWAQGLPQLWSVWECKNCGYRGAFILENGNLAQKLQEEWTKKNRTE